jgi:glycosyltransferase involved in cell wall biosynthesis
MRLLYVADGRSLTARNWMGNFIQAGHEVHLVSTFPCDPINGLASLEVIPVAMSDLYGQSGMRRGGVGSLLRKVFPVELRTRIRQVLAPLSFQRAASAFIESITRVQPQLIHAMRIPFEGMVASLAVSRLRGAGEWEGVPLLISVWGNDFTLHAISTPSMAVYTRQALQHCDGLHTDCQRDLRLARNLGFPAEKPGIVLPGGGGVRLDVFYPPESASPVVERGFTVINPRGIRTYVRNDTIFKAMPMVRKECPDVRFICTGMAGEPQARKWVADLGLAGYVDLLPQKSHPEMADLFRRSQVSLSITTHDGTPNSLLEAMACGCFPIAGDIESIREWITPGENGLLVDPTDPDKLASAILACASQPELRKHAHERNLQLVRERGEYHQTILATEKFYRQMVGQ